MLHHQQKGLLLFPHYWLLSRGYCDLVLCNMQVFPTREWRAEEKADHLVWLHGWQRKSWWRNRCLTRNLKDLYKMSESIAKKYVPKLNFCKTLTRKVWSSESKAFSKSIATRIPGLLFLFAYSKISSIVLIASKIDLPLINAFWLWWTRTGKIDSNVIAIALDGIFTSMFISEIGRQFCRSLLSLSFFSISVIIACFWEVDNSPWRCAKFRHSTGLAHDVGAQIKICKIRKKICFRIAVILRLFTCSCSNELHLVAIFTVQLRYIRTTHTRIIRSYFAYTRMYIRVCLYAYTRMSIRAYMTLCYAFP